MRGSRTLGAACCLAALLSATACSSGANPADVNARASTFTAEDPTAATASDNPSAITSPSPGAVTSADKSFNFVVPTGWNLTKNPKALAYLSSTLVAHDVAPTIVVTKSDVTPAPALEETVQMAMMQARQDNATTNKSASRTIGGEKAEGFTSDSTESGVQLRRMYYVVVHRNVSYTIALTSAAADATGPSSTLNAFLSSWTWGRAGDKNSTANGTTPALSPTSTASTSSSSPASSGSAGTASPTGGTTPAPSTKQQSHGAVSSTSAPTK